MKSSSSALASLGSSSSSSSYLNILMISRISNLTLVDLFLLIFSSEKDWMYISWRCSQRDGSVVSCWFFPFGMLTENSSFSFDSLSLKNGVSSRHWSKNGRGLYSTSSSPLTRQIRPNAETLSVLSSIFSIFGLFFYFLTGICLTSFSNS